MSKVKQRVEGIISFLLVRFDRFVMIGVILCPLLIIGYYYSGVTRKAPVREDAVGYYAFLPATFNFKDLSFSFMIDEANPYTQGINTFERNFNPEEAEIMGFNQLADGSYLNKYPVGVAVLLLPFFIFGHVLSLLFGVEANGWSFFYQYSCFWGGIVYFLLGISFLKKILLKHFSSKVTFLTLITLIFGTNLFNYATYENIYSHVFSFFLITLLLYLTPQWLERLDWKRSILIGLNLGLIMLVRQTNVIFSILLLLYGVSTFKQFKKRISLFQRSYKKILIVLCTAFAVFLPQLLYWKFSTGSWFAYSYGEEGFLFLQPKLFQVLFGTSKGLFFWSPILLFAFVGFFMLKGRGRRYLLPSIIILCIQIYIVSSWWNWEFGWSFGHRAFTDSLGLFALGLGGFYSAVAGSKLKVGVLCITFLLLFLSIFQMVQYWLKILPPARTTLEDYFRIFLRLDKDLRYFWKDYFK